ncbi:type II toxin-antitoxin system VapC family toxin [Sphingomonas baiyangensis]|uniref:Ribonuclease VapC n=1 Tax=Sphingomonas baiyangensis TaxID=2572576 RepID=A0A4U1L0J7_9SPHN|nr:type II toxin-antitoxin system VapC family toxin [Sphingomonas baiyangensis]TKD50084.1 type II toxin-antitoxin system VapC family toxin [Sphingomonas baiyangensis]
MIFLDSNAAIDLLATDDTRWSVWASAVFESSIDVEPLVCNLIVVAEVAAGTNAGSDILTDLARLEIEVVALTDDAAPRAATAFREYRRRGGSRSTLLPDFLIAAHAETLGARLMTRDQRLASYFPDLTLITPETHP